jgi:hypothetical protein
MERNLTEVESKILEALKVVIKENFEVTKRPMWTKLVFDALKTLGDSQKQVTYCHTLKDINQNEWLFDLIWSKEGISWHEFKGLSLACELEWSDTNEDVLTDFQKLTVVVADIRLMIINNWDEYSDKYFEGKFEICYKASQQISNKFNYLLIGLPVKHPENVVFKAWNA